MKKIKFLLLVLMAFFALSTSVKAVTDSRLFVTIKDYNVGDILGEYDTDPTYNYVEVAPENTVQLKAIKAHGNEMSTEQTPAGWYVDEINLNATYSSNNTKVATVNSKGFVTAISKGIATIKVSYGGNTEEFEIRVINDCEKRIGSGEYIINFETGNGTTIDPVRICITCADGTNPVTLPKPLHAENGFLGWYKDKDLTQPVDTSLPENIGNYKNSGCYDLETTIYADWDRIKLTNDNTNNNNNSDTSNSDKIINNNDDSSNTSSDKFTNNDEEITTDENSTTGIIENSKDKNKNGLKIYEIIIILAIIFILLAILLFANSKKLKGEKK